QGKACWPEAEGKYVIDTPDQQAIRVHGPSGPCAMSVWQGFASPAKHQPRNDTPPFKAGRMAVPT
ncbi:MAG: hypothetical protein LBB40_02965, partial [Holophagales bacterium]|nr:hypothetical protein [Holophagales bacterium]